MSEQQFNAEKKFKRTAFVLVALGVAAFAWTLNRFAERDSSAERAHPTSAPATSGVEAAVRPAIAPAPQRAAGSSVDERLGSRAPARAAEQTARGELHFERAGIDAARIDLEPRHGFGRWQPSERKLRVVLTQRELGAAELARLGDALASGGGTGFAEAYGVLELTFVPTAQAFDRSELDTAVLTVTDAAGATASADVLGSVEWHGSLPAGTAVRPTQLALTATGRQRSNDGAQQSWQLDVALPVTSAE